MKLFLRKSTVLALGYTSSAYAFDAPVLRSSAESSCTGQYDCCQSGTLAGEKSASSLWAASPFYGNCDNVWDLQSSADEMKDTLYPANEADSWQVQAYNECARIYGVDPRVAEIEEGCLGDDSSQCIDLGETAASMIVYENVCGRYVAPYAHQDYLQDCREVAYGVCEGDIKSKIQEQCSDKWPVSTSELSRLMGMCEDQVNSMVPITTKIPTRRPTRRPTPGTDRDNRGECAGGGPYESGSFCYTARQQCCSSVKKYDAWQAFCKYYGFDYPPIGLFQIIVPSTFLSVDCTMCGTSKCTSGDTELALDGADTSNDDESVDFEDEDVKYSEEYVLVADHSNDVVSLQ